MPAFELVNQGRPDTDTSLKGTKHWARTRTLSAQDFTTLCCGWAALLDDLLIWFMRAPIAFFWAAGIALLLLLPAGRWPAFVAAEVPDLFWDTGILR